MGVIASEGGVLAMASSSNMANSDWLGPGRYPSHDSLIKRSFNKSYSGLGPGTRKTPSKGGGGGSGSRRRAAGAGGGAADGTATASPMGFGSRLERKGSHRIGTMAQEGGVMVMPTTDNMATSDWLGPGRYAPQESLVKKSFNRYAQPQAERPPLGHDDSDAAAGSVAPASGVKHSPIDTGLRGPRQTKRSAASASSGPASARKGGGSSGSGRGGGRGDSASGAGGRDALASPGGRTPGASAGVERTLDSEARTRRVIRGGSRSGKAMSVDEDPTVA